MSRESPVTGEEPASAVAVAEPSLYESIATQAQDAILAIDDGGRIRFANPAVADVFGYDPETLLGQPLTRLMPERLRARHRRAMADYLATGERATAWGDVRLTGRTASGEEVPLSISFSEVAVDGERLFVGICRDVADRVEVEAAQRARDERFRAVAEHLESVVWMSDPGTTSICYVNPAYEAVWGRPTESLYADPRSFLDAVHPDDRERVAAAVEAQAEGEYDEEYRIVRPDGEVRWVHDRAVPVADDGEVVRIIGFATDVTDRKRREMELQRTIERVTDAIVKVDADWRFTFVDDRAGEIYDVEPESLLGRDFWTVFESALGTRFEEEYRRTMETREPAAFEAHYPFLEGWFRVNVYPDDDGGLSFYFRDVTGRKERERELEFRAALLEAQAEATIDGLLVVDEDRQIVQYNERFLEIWGLEPGYLESAPDGRAVVEEIKTRLEDPDGFAESVEHLWAHPHEERRDEFRFTDGRWIDRYSAPVVDDGTYFGRLWVFRDVTERREHERALEAHKERLESFASIVSHDLRNPLEVAEGYLEMAREEDDPEALAQVDDALGRIRGLVEDLLALVRANESIGEREPVALAAAVERCWETVETADVTLSVETTRTVEADPSRLAQLLENLFRNAVEHGGGSVHLRVGDTPDGFFVEDDGPGVPTDRRERVFEAGVSSVRDGTGLGLAIVERVARAHGWTVSLAAGADDGARFEVSGVEPA